MGLNLGQNLSVAHTRVTSLPLFCMIQNRPVFKGIVHFEINFWYVLAYLKGIQDIGVFVSTIV